MPGTKIAALLAIALLPASLWAQLSVRSAASYAEPVSPGSVAALFGNGLSSHTAAGRTDRLGRWPRELAGVRVEVDGSAAGLLYVSPTQINFTVPEDAPLGTANFVVAAAGGAVLASGVLEVAAAAPGFFSADGSGSGAGLISNLVTRERAPFLVRTEENPGCDKRTRLSAFATGLRSSSPDRDPLDSNIAEFVRLVIENAPGGSIEVAEVEYAGPDEALEGIDRVNFVLPEGLTGGEEISLRLVVDGVESNSVAARLEPAEAADGDCLADGFAVAFNTVADLLAGDLWDVTDPAAVFSELSDVPGHWPLMGVGTTAEAGHNGEVIAFGTAAMPELVWSDPEFPLTVRTLSDESIPFVGLAAGDPDTAIVAKAEPGRPIHAQAIELARANNLAFAGIRVSGRFSGVSYSVAHNLLKEGTPLTDPAVDKAPFQLFFLVEEEVEWELSGFYAASAAVQEIVSVRGAPVHLHGFQLDRSRAGHLGAANVEQATIQLYPLQAPIVVDGDLAIRATPAGAGRIALEVLNRGDTAITRTTVQGLVGDTVVFQAALASLNRQESRMIEIELPESVPQGNLRVVVDPFNDVLERDEANNVAYVSGID